MEKFLTIKLCTYAKLDLALNNLQRLICHNTQQNQSTIYFGLFYFIVYQISWVI